MNKRTSLVAALMLIAGSALADSPAPSTPSAPSADAAAHGLDRLAILLDLDAGQKTAVKQVFDEQAKERKELWDKARESQTRPSHEEMHAQHEKMHKEMVEKLRPILSDQQMTKFEALSEGPPHGAFGGMPGHRPDKESQDKGQ